MFEIANRRTSQLGGILRADESEILARLESMPWPSDDFTLTSCFIIQNICVMRIHIVSYASSGTDCSKYNALTRNGTVG